MTDHAAGSAAIAAARREHVRLSRARACAAAAAVVAFVAVWLGTLGMRSLTGSDEGRYASMSLAMLQSGDWVTPRLNGLLYFEKPPLQYWAGAAGMALFGANEFAARLWPGLCGLFTVLLVGTTAARLWGRRAGLCTALVAGSTGWIVANSHYLSLDAGLTAALTLVLCALLRADAQGADPADAGAAARRRRWLLAAWAGIALAVLSKGLVGLLIPVVVLVLHALWLRDAGLLRRLEWMRGVALLLLIAAPWFVLVSARNPGFADFFFVHEHLQRYLTTQHHRVGPWWYFIPFLLVGLLPWTPWLPAVARPRADADRASRLLVTWAAFVFVFFSASGSKLPSYILPMFPALALLLGRHLAAAGPAALRRPLLALALLWAAVLAVAPFADRLAAHATSVEALAPLIRGATLGAALCLAALAGAWWLLRRARVLAALALVAASHLAMVLLLLGAHDAYGRLRSGDEIARVLAPLADASVPVYSIRSYDHTLQFYLRRTITLVDFVDEFEFGERQQPQAWVPTLDAFVARWQADARAAAYMTWPEHQELETRGVPMRTVYADARRVVVVKP